MTTGTLISIPHTNIHCDIYVYNIHRYVATKVVLGRKIYSQWLLLIMSQFGSGWTIKVYTDTVKE